MKTVKIAGALLIITLLAVIINSITLRSMLADILERVTEAEEQNMSIAYEEYTEIFDYFKGKEPLISLTVNHEDLTAIEDGFAEIIGAAEAGDKEGLLMVKSRLKSSIEHLRRLSGINLESIL